MANGQQQVEKAIEAGCDTIEQDYGMGGTIMKKWLKGISSGFLEASENSASFFAMPGLGRLAVKQPATLLIVRGTAGQVPRKLSCLEGISSMAVHAMSIARHSRTGICQPPGPHHKTPGMNIPLQQVLGIPVQDMEGFPGSPGRYL